ncbi:hypothetical protein ILUMI_26520 [Ignelater luminosus]|uniref:GAG-pre-integrase domain-containing protein n=1 Tax=Ignelater luminosus TaxID=2038154 RepID=A0A8K0FYV5_IGNLU|nr:hypothetical protein ILUMI_26520 [Ignelater luminosus]
MDKSVVIILKGSENWPVWKFRQELAAHVSSLEDTRNRLKQLGEDMSDRMLIAKILMTLSNELAHFASTWKLVDENKQTLNKLMSRLLIEEERIISSKIEMVVPLTTVKRGKQFEMQFKIESSSFLAGGQKQFGLKEWHQRLPHQNFPQVRSVLKRFDIDFKDNGNECCTSCLEGKQHRFPFYSSTTKYNSVEEMHKNKIANIVNSTIVHVMDEEESCETEGSLEEVVNEEEVITEIDEAKIEENQNREKNRAGGEDESVASYDLRDSGSTEHKSGSREWIESLRPCSRDVKISDGSIIKAEAVGHVKRLPEAPPICGFVGANWAGDTKGTKSTSGFSFEVVGNCVTRSSKKRDSVSLSLAESEFVVLSLACSEACWLRNTVDDLQVVTVSKIELFEDNQAAKAFI